MYEVPGVAGQDDRQFGWIIPSTLAVVAASPVRPRDVGNAAILRGSIPDFFEHREPAHYISFVLGGKSTVEWKQGGRLERFVAAPGGFSVCPGGRESAYRCGQVLETLTLGIEPSRLSEIADREFRPYGGSVELVPAHQRSNPEVVGLGHSFASLVRSPRPGSGLYAETLWTQIAIQLLWSYSNLPRRSEPGVERLSDGRIRRVLDFVESSLGEEISLADLADLAGLSPNQFIVAFKKSTRKTPHRYLVERRLSRACEHLRDPRMSLASVALSVGFSSQSHFTTVFGRFMDTTPAAYRRQVLGIEGELE